MAPDNPSVHLHYGLFLMDSEKNLEAAREFPGSLQIPFGFQREESVYANVQGMFGLPLRTKIQDPSVWHSMLIFGKQLIGNLMISITILYFHIEN